MGNYNIDVLKDENGNVIRPATITDNVVNPTTRKTVTEEINELGLKVNEIVGKEDEIIDLALIAPTKGVMSTNDTAYSGADGSKYQHKNIAVHPNDRYVLTSNGQGITVYAFVKSVGVSGDIVDLCEGEERTALLAGETSTILTVPSDAVYLCINTLYEMRDISPIVTKLGNEGELNKLKNAVKFDQEQTLTTEQKKRALNNIGIDDADGLIDLFNQDGLTVEELPISNINVLNNYFISGSGEKSEYNHYSIHVYDVSTTDRVTITGTNTYSNVDNPRAYAFYADSELTIKVGDVGEKIPALSYHYDLQVPDGAKYLGCCVDDDFDPTISVSIFVKNSNTKMSQLLQDVDEMKHSGTTSREIGLYKSGADYYHFCKRGGQTIIRKFRREGPNNLFQLSQIGTGIVNGTNVTITNVINTSGTDVVGPVSLYNTSLFSGYGEWTGGYHTKSVAGVAYPTAKQSSLSINVNGVDVVNDGMYYGEVHIKAVNDLYFPQSITGANLTTATKALTETREYVLNDRMTVKVKMNANKTVYISCYYGMQAVTNGFDNIFLPNNGKEFTIASLTENYYLLKPERKMYLFTGNRHYDLTLKDIGCGQFDNNTKVFGFFAKGRYKAYFMCIQDANKAKEIDSSQSAKRIDEGTCFGWEGIYDIYFD